MSGSIIIETTHFSLRSSVQLHSFIITKQFEEMNLNGDFNLFLKDRFHILAALRKTKLKYVAFLPKRKLPFPIKIYNTFIFYEIYFIDYDYNAVC